MSQEVDPDDRCARIFEQSRETIPLPSGRERSTPTVNQRNSRHIDTQEMLENTIEGAMDSQD